MTGTFWIRNTHHDIACIVGRGSVGIGGLDESYADTGICRRGGNERHDVSGDKGGNLVSIQQLEG